jgi:ABC-type nitrate/sulfonate/bicarbonate transport system ATPase subunit
MKLEPKLELKRVAKSFVTGGRRTPVLADISLSVGEGEFVSIIGPSGSGKTTLFHIVGGLIRPDAGQVLLDGREVTGKKGLISYIPQQHSLFPWRTVTENVILAQEVAGIPKAEARAKAREWLPKVGLAGYEDAYPHVLSGGMQQRASFLRAMLSPQELMCLDEPFGALDALTRFEMQQWLLKLWEESRRSVLFVTHSIEEALLLSDRIYVFSEKPTSILKEIVVPFSRPRTDAVMTDSAFSKLRQEIYELMKRERGAIE